MSTATVDWKSAAIYVGQHFTFVKAAFDGFLSAHPEFAGECSVENYPPRIAFSLYMPAPDKTRRKTVAVFKDPRTLVQALLPRVEELDIAATFVGSISGDLKPRRTNEKGEAHLSYELRPDYEKFTNA